MSRLSDAIAVIEEKLGDSRLYDQSCEARAEHLPASQEQAAVRAGTGEAEMARMEIQESLEATDTGI